MQHRNANRTTHSKTFRVATFCPGAVQNRLAIAKEEHGQTMAEYGVVLAVIAVIVVVALTALSGAITGALTRVTGVLTP